MICGSPVSPDPAGADADGSVYWAHDCECLMEIAIVRTAIELDDNFFENLEINVDPEKDTKLSGQPKLPPWYLAVFEREYKSRCHNCNKHDGIDNRLSACKRDGDYLFTCQYCGHSLRTHHLFGEGKKYDRANKGSQ